MLQQVGKYIGESRAKMAGKLSVFESEAEFEKFQYST